MPTKPNHIANPLTWIITGQQRLLAAASSPEARGLGWGAFSFKVPGRLPAGAAFSRTACRRLPAGRLLAEMAVKRADWWAWGAFSCAGSLAGDALVGQSRSPNIVPFHVWYSFPLCNSNFVTMALLRYSTSKNVVTLKFGLEVTQGHLKWYHSID